MDNELFTSRLIDFNKRSHAFMQKHGEFSLIGNTEELAINSCGDCIACCVFPTIPSEQYEAPGMNLTATKKFGQRCVYCTGKGCHVYEIRPEVCRGYLCFWKFGLVDHPPNETGVAWSLEPNKETLRHWVAVGHCADVDTVLGSADRLAEIRQFLTMVVMWLPVGFVIVRSATKVAKVNARGSRLIVEACDVVDDNAILSTLRTTIARPCKKKNQ